eukprot:gene11267-4080_t
MGAEGYVRIYDRKMVNEILNLIGYNGNFKDLGNYNIYKRSIFGHDIYTVYYGDNPGYEYCFYQDTLKIEKNKYVDVMKSRFENLKEKMKYGYNVSDEYRLDIDDI